MKPRQICEGVSALGAVDWNRRMFDALIPLPDGTSYNAYLVRGSEKTALVDTADPAKADILMAQLAGVDRIDYLVTNHAEQDHSGSIPLVLEKYPEAIVLCSVKAKGMLSDLLEVPAERFTVVQDGDTLELARLGNNLTKQSGLTEKGQIVPGLNDYQDSRDGDWEYVKTTPYSNRHEVLTGSQLDGRAFPAEFDYTCDNWTSNADPAPEFRQGGLVADPNRPNAWIGFPDRNGGGNGSWNSSHGTRGCSQTALVNTHGVGKLYCFVID